MTAKEVIGELRRLHPSEGGEWAFFAEQFRIDAYAIRLWGASGDHPFRRVAYEVKVSRSDFNVELRHPEKRQPALAISHQFYFAMPADLAEWALPRIPEECGLLAVLNEPERGAWHGRSPFVGAGYNPRVKIARRAPLRPCRGFTDYQIINLIRRADREPGLDDALHQAAVEREHALAERQRAKKARAELENCRRRLEKVGRPLLEPGTRWTGDWERRGRKLRGATVVLEAVNDGWISTLPARVSARLLTNDGEPMIGYDAVLSLSAGEFLEGWDRLDQVATKVEAG